MSLVPSSLRSVTDRWRTRTPIPVARDETYPLSVIFVEFPDDRERSCLSHLSGLYGKRWTVSPGGPHVHSALWTSVGTVMRPRLPLIMDDLQLEIRGRAYDDGSI